MFEGIELKQKWVIKGSESPTYKVIGQSVGDELEILFRLSDGSPDVTRAVAWVKENMTQIG